jgi:hypothetical protein
VGLPATPEQAELTPELVLQPPPPEEEHGTAQEQEHQQEQQQQQQQEEEEEEEEEEEDVEDVEEVEHLLATSLSFTKRRAQNAPERSGQLAVCEGMTLLLRLTVLEAGVAERNWLVVRVTIGHGHASGAQASATVAGGDGGGVGAVRADDGGCSHLPSLAAMLGSLPSRAHAVLDASLRAHLVQSYRRVRAGRAARWAGRFCQLGGQSAATDTPDRAAMVVTADTHDDASACAAAQDAANARQELTPEAAQAPRPVHERPAPLMTVARVWCAVSPSPLPGAQ